MNLKLSSLFVTLLFCCSEAMAGKLCIYRYEDNGAINLRPVEIRIDGQVVFSLIGGSKECYYLEPGTYDVIATSRNPWEPNSTDDFAWRSNSIRVNSTGSGVIYMKVEPIAVNSAYTGPWSIEVLQDKGLFEH